MVTGSSHSKLPKLARKGLFLYFHIQFECIYEPVLRPFIFNPLNRLAADTESVVMQAVTKLRHQCHPLHPEYILLTAEMRIDPHHLPERVLVRADHEPALVHFYRFKRYRRHLHPAGTKVTVSGGIKGDDLPFCDSHYVMYIALSAHTDDPELLIQVIIPERTVKFAIDEIHTIPPRLYSTLHRHSMFHAESAG